MALLVILPMTLFGVLHQKTIKWSKWDECCNQDIVYRFCFQVDNLIEMRLVVEDISLWLTAEIILVCIFLAEIILKYAKL